MDGLASLILAAVLGGTPLVLQPPDRPCSDALPSLDVELELGPRPIDAAPGSLRVVEAMVEQSVYLSPTGWLGLEVHDQLALLVDLRIDRLPTSPDPARPEARDAITARFGVELRPPLL